MGDKIVSKKYVLKEFSQIGLVLMIYIFFALYIPYILENYVDLNTIPFINYIPFDKMLVIRVLCIFIGSIFPFFALYLSDRKNINLEKTKLSFKDRFAYVVVFISIISFVVYISGSVLTYFNVETKVLSNIGLDVDANYFNNYLYILIHVIFLPILEEFAFRKVILNILSKYGKRFAIFTCALLYAFAHCSISDFFPSLIMAYILNKIYLKYKSFGFVCFTHILYNLVMFLAISITEEYNRFVFILLFTIILIAIILIVGKKYKYIYLPQSDFNKNTFWMFLSSKTIILSILMMIAFTVIQIVL